MKVSQLMTQAPEQLERSDDVELAKLLMSLGRFRHLPVLDRGTLVGVVSDRDLLRALGDFGDIKTIGRELPKFSIENLMQSPVETIDANASALQAATMMKEKKLGCLPVLEAGKMVGIVTLTDFLDLSIRVLSDPG